MSRRAQTIVLAALLAVLGIVLYFNLRKAPETVTVSSPDEKFQPLPLENPSLRLDMLERIRRLEYKGTHRNIFSASAPPLPPKVDPKKTGPPGPPPVEPITVPAKFFGYASDPQGGHRRAFFSNGEDVFVVAEGETLLNRFRLVRIGNTTAEVEEIASGRHATLVLEETSPSA